jgi:transposase
LSGSALVERLRSGGGSDDSASKTLSRSFRRALSEACLSAHFVSRTLRALGHEPRIVPAIYVKFFVKGQKNDYNDAEAIAKAALRPNLRFVREKSQDQLDLQACHRVRSQLVSRRTATINQIRAFLIEQGIAVGPARMPSAIHSSRYWRTERTRSRPERPG